jgi:peptidoglycan hydrolase-like protein with peptidoglycan-binding domain
MSEKDKIINIAINEIGYLEKSWAAYNENPEVIYDKVAGAGSDNVTKYAKEMDDLCVYNTPKNGYPWCKVFVDWLFVQAFGLDKAGELLHGWTAGVEQFYDWYNSNGQIYYHPEIGDLVIFGDCYHIGIITDFDDDRIYTIEGNTSADVECEANGGAVAQKSYSRYSSWINCYARPNYENSPEPPTPPTPPQPTHRMLYYGCQGDDVEYIQDKLLEKGYALPTYGADGYYGGETEDAIRQLQADAGIGVDGICGDETWAVIDSNFVRPDRPEYPGYLIRYGDTGEDVRIIQQRLIELGYSCGYYGADGIFGYSTESAVKAFQRDHGLAADGIVGPDTWNELF